MSLQLIIVAVIGVIVAVIVLRQLYKFFFVKRDTPYCGGCSGCEISQKQRK